MQLDTVQIEKSLNRKCLYATKVLQDEASFLNGLAKVKNYLLQKKPTANGLPIFVIPYSDDLKSLFAFMINCESRDYDCERCFFRNECLRKAMKRVIMSVSRLNRKHTAIEDLFNQDKEFRVKGYNIEALILLRKIITQLGEIE